jgi:hypothetical protein
LLELTAASTKAIERQADGPDNGCHQSDAASISRDK